MPWRPIHKHSYPSMSCSCCRCLFADAHAVRRCSSKICNCRNCWNCWNCCNCFCCGSRCCCCLPLRSPAGCCCCYCDLCRCCCCCWHGCYRSCCAIDVVDAAASDAAKAKIIAAACAATAACACHTIAAPVSVASLLLRMPLHTDMKWGASASSCPLALWSSRACRESHISIAIVTHGRACVLLWHSRRSTCRRSCTIDRLHLASTTRLTATSLCVHTCVWCGEAAMGCPTALTPVGVAFRPRRCAASRGVSAGTLPEKRALRAAGGRASKQRCAVQLARVLGEMLPWPRASAPRTTGVATELLAVDSSAPMPTVAGRGSVPGASTSCCALMGLGASCAESGLTRKNSRRSWSAGSASLHATRAHAPPCARGYHCNCRGRRRHMRFHPHRSQRGQRIRPNTAQNRRTGSDVALQTALEVEIERRAGCTPVSPTRDNRLQMQRGTT